MILAALAGPPSAEAADGVSARHHPWGRFQPGAWKLVRVVTETLDEQGDVIGTSVTETKTSLLRVDSDGVLLEVEVGVEVAGKQFDGSPQCIKQGFHGELSSAAVKVQPPAPGKVEIADRQVECQVQKIEVAGPNSRTKTDIYFSETTSPYILKRHSTTTDLEGKNSLDETTISVVDLDMPYRVLSEIKTVACLRIVQKHAKGSVTTLAMTSKDVPGGVVYHSSKEIDASGRVARRSTLELVSFGLQSDDERTGLFGRKRPPRRKPTGPR